MKKIGIVLLMGAALALASPAKADQIQVGYTGSNYGPYQQGSGGEFTLNDVNPEGWLDLSGYALTTKNFGPVGITSFQSFCIEGLETINVFPTTYNAQLSNLAMFGSVGPPGDPISVGTGFLYSQFAKGTLAGYDYTDTGVGRKTSAGLLQNVLWYLEGEEGITLASLAGNTFATALAAQFGTVDNAALTTSIVGGISAAGLTAADYNVQAINLWTGTDPTTNRAQDQLYYGPTKGTSVPDGGTTLSLLGMALCGMAVLSRRFRKA